MGGDAARMQPSSISSVLDKSFSNTVQKQPMPEVEWQSRRRCLGCHIRDLECDEVFALGVAAVQHFDAVNVLEDRQVGSSSRSSAQASLTAHEADGVEPVAEGDDDEAADIVRDLRSSDSLRMPGGSPR
jgi:hypothetical protein